MEECTSAFEAIKRYITEPPILSNPETDEELYMYFVMSKYIVNVVLFWQALSNGQKLFYYVSKDLVDAKTRYSQVEQMTLTLCIAVKKVSSILLGISQIYLGEWWSELLN